MRRVPFHCKTVPYNTSTQGKQTKTLRHGKTRAQSRTTTGHDAKKTAKNLASRQDKAQSRTTTGHNAGKTAKNLASRHDKAQSRTTTTGHDAGKTKKNFASRYGKSKHHTIQDTTQRKHSKTLRRGVEEGKKLAMSSRFAEDARAGLHRIRTDGYDVDVHGFEVVAGGFIHAGVGHYSIELVCHCDEGQSSLVDLA